MIAHSTPSWRIGLAALAATFASAVHAHDFFLLPERFQAPAGGVPAVRATVGSSFPRPENSVPACIRNAQYEVAGLAVAGVELTVTTEAGPVLKRKKTDVLEKEWFEGTADRAPVFGSVDAALSPLFGAETSGIITTAELGRV